MAMANTGMEADIGKPNKQVFYQYLKGCYLRAPVIE